MASSIAAITTGIGGVVTTADNSGDLNLQSGTTTIVSITSAGAAVTGTLSSTSGTTIQGITVGKGGGAVATNTAVGASALAANTSGTENTANGYQALFTNTTGSFNSSYGVVSLKLNTTGSYNNAFGDGALQNNTTGSNNIGVGVQALYSNTTASNNTAVGYQAGYTNSTGLNSVYIGYKAGYLATANTNTCVGFTAGTGLTTGAGNTFIGGESGSAATTGNYNCFIGEAAGYYVTTGSKNTILGGYNGNQSSLDIRTASNYVVLSDGDGQPMAFWDGRRNLSVNSWYNGEMNINAYLARGVITAGDYGGGGITTSNLFNGNASTGFLHVVESGTTNYLIAAIFKRNSSTAPVVTVIASSVLSVLATNTGGTIAINGATTGANVKMRYIGYDVTF
jgi:hypothetical protein